MHFFNPPAQMRLLEVVAGDASGRNALAVAREAGEAMGKHVIEAADAPGLPRQPLQPPVRARGAAARPGGDRDAGAGRPDLPDGGRLPDGPVRADGPRRARRRLRGVALVLRAVVRRAALAAVAAGRADGGGRAAGPQDRPRLVRVSARPAGRSRAAGTGRRARARGDRRRQPGDRALRAWAAGAGWDVDGADVPGVVARRPPARRSATAARSPTLDPGGAAAGFHLLPPLGRLVELTAQPTTEPAALEAAELFFGSLGMHAELRRRRSGARARPDRRAARQRGRLRARRGHRFAPLTSTQG